MSRCRLNLARLTPPGLHPARRALDGLRVQTRAMAAPLELERGAPRGPDPASAFLPGRTSGLSPEMPDAAGTPDEQAALEPTPTVVSGQTLEARIDLGFRGPVLITAAYVISLFLLVLGAMAGSLVPLSVALVLFSVWDCAWLARYARRVERTAQEMLDSSTRARTYMSYYIAIYGAGLGYFVFGLSPQRHREIVVMLVTAHVPPWLLVAPVVLSGIAILFFPVQLGSRGDGDLKERPPSGANLAVVTINAWVQKVATYTFLYSILLVLGATWRI